LLLPHLRSMRRHELRERAVGLSQQITRRAKLDDVARAQHEHLSVRVSHHTASMCARTLS
jgi:hypothetical protein